MTDEVKLVPLEQLEKQLDILDVKPKNEECILFVYQGHKSDILTRFHLSSSGGCAFI